MKKPLELAQYFSREHTLFYARVWQDSNLHYLEKWVGSSIKNMLCLGASDKKLSVWYSREELQDFDTAVVKKLLNDDAYLDKVESEYYKYWGQLLKYLTGEKQIKKPEDFKEYFELWKAWWAPMAVIFETIDLFHLPQTLRDRALKAREATQGYSDMGDQIFIDSFVKLYPEHKEEVYTFLPEDIFAGNLKDGALKAKALNTGYGLLNGGLFSISDLDKELKENDLSLEKIILPDSVKELKGMSASRGKVIGRVRLVLYKNQISKLDEGEILVTEMTSPDYLPAMKKAAAFVTNEGGMTCHAAIVARELKKPCVVGTKFATKILKDGDMVEVDADKGVVKILSSK